MNEASFLFSEYRRKVLELLLLNPQKQFHQREIARLTQTISGTLSRELAKMVEARLIIKFAVGNQMHYRANLESPIFHELVSILQKTSGWSQTLTQSIVELGDKVECAFVFGSTASGQAGLHSDIDILVVGSVSFSELVTHLYPIQEQLGREINPKLYQPEEWEQALHEQSAFVRDVLAKPKLLLKGSDVRFHQ